MEARILELLTRFGPSLLFLAQMFGIFGLPIPDELLLTIAGALVRRGALGGPATFTAAVAGCVAGITLSYALGRTVGAATLARVARAHGEGLARSQRWFRRFGGWLLAFGYFIPGVRHVTALAAGATPMSARRFAAFAYPGAVAWCATFLGLGYYAGDRWREAAATARGHARLLVVVAVVLLAAWLVTEGPRQRA